MPFSVNKNIRKFLRFTAIRNRNDDIIIGNHPQITVASLSWMHKKGNRAGGGECGSHFASDMTGFTHTGNNNTSFCILQQIQCSRKITIQIIFQDLKSFNFPINSFNSVF